MARFLIIDDHPLFREALLSAISLAFTDATAVEARSINEALSALAENPAFDLALLDLNMPRKDGRTALREIKASPVLQRIPIVILTTSKAEEDIVRTYNLGVNSFICKPVTFDSLVEIVKTVGRYWIEIVALPPECHRAVA